MSSQSEEVKLEKNTGFLDSAAIGLSASTSFIFSVMGSAVGIFIAWLFMRSDKVDFN